MLTKTQFLKRINFIIEYDKSVEKYDQALKEFAHSDFTGYYDVKLHNHLINMLVEDMDLEPDDDLISWWLYDCPQAGKHPEYAKIWSGDKDDPDTIEYDVSTPEKLYNYIFACYAKSPSKESLQLALKAQDNGVKFALRTIGQVKETNEKAHNKEWLERGILMEYLIKKITNNYLLAAGVRHNLNLDGDYYIISSLEES